jgi:hypothetical protein
MSWGYLDQKKMTEEAARLLRENGLLLISSLNWVRDADAITQRSTLFAYGCLSIPVAPWAAEPVALFITDFVAVRPGSLWFWHSIAHLKSDHLIFESYWNFSAFYPCRSTTTILFYYAGEIVR